MEHTGTSLFVVQTTCGTSHNRGCWMLPGANFVKPCADLRRLQTAYKNGLHTFASIRRPTRKRSAKWLLDFWKFPADEGCKGPTRWQNVVTAVVPREKVGKISHQAPGLPKVRKYLCFFARKKKPESLLKFWSLLGKIVTNKTPELLPGQF